MRNRGEEMQREYFCCGCGLFHWLNMYQTDETTGRIDRLPYRGCPNSECVTHQTHDETPIFAVDTTGFAYFAESHQDFINEVKWSSPKYAPEEAIEVYKKQGFAIKG